MLVFVLAQELEEAKSTVPFKSRQRKGIASACSLLLMPHLSSSCWCF